MFMDETRTLMSFIQRMKTSLSGSALKDDKLIIHEYTWIHKQEERAEINEQVACALHPLLYSGGTAGRLQTE